MNSLLGPPVHWTHLRLSTVCGARERAGFIPVILKGTDTLKGTEIDVDEVGGGRDGGMSYQYPQLNSPTKNLSFDHVLYPIG